MNHATVANARAKLAAALPSTTEILRGSLLHRRIRHRSGCSVCARGKGHLIWVAMERAVVFELSQLGGLNDAGEGTAAGAEDPGAGHGPEGGETGPSEA